ncbi:MAG: JAB domain-containing protein [Candidatus Thorarchaeota archaeon]
MTVKLSKELKEKKMKNPSDMYSIIQGVLLKKSRISRDKEHLWLMLLDNSMKIKHLELIGIGTINDVSTSPLEIFSVALYRRAVKLVLIHNHPSNELLPSKSDMQLTYQLLKVGVFIEIPVIDHLIIGTNGYYSFADNGLL